MKGFWFWLLLLLVAEFASVPVQAETSKAKNIYRHFTTTNSAGRSGVYFLPSNYRSRKLPAMLLFHGSSIDGAAVAGLFKSLAKKRKFIIIAPDSVNTFGWEISFDVAQPTEDQVHIASCLAEVKALAKVRIKPEKFLVAGISAGGALAAYYGSMDTSYTSFAVLHGGVDLPSLGQSRIPVWLSTGSEDTLRPPSELLSYQSALSALSFTSVTYREYLAAHEVKRAERKDLIMWWLG